MGEEYNKLRKRARMVAKSRNTWGDLSQTVSTYLGWFWTPYPLTGAPLPELGNIFPTADWFLPEGYPEFGKWLLGRRDSIQSNS
jgi:hypothetical protein